MFPQNRPVDLPCENKQGGLRIELIGQTAVEKFGLRGVDF
jgi:hypothetical protein